MSIIDNKILLPDIPNPNQKSETREGPITEMDLTPYGEEVYVTLKDRDVYDRFDKGIPEVLQGKTLLMKRTGSHTWQLIKGIDGWYGNFMPEVIEAVYTKDKHPQYFI